MSGSTITVRLRQQHGHPRRRNERRQSRVARWRPGRRHDRVGPGPGRQQGPHRLPAHGRHPGAFVLLGTMPAVLAAGAGTRRDRSALGPGRQRGSVRHEGNRRRFHAGCRWLAALHIRQGPGPRRRHGRGRQDLWWDLVCRVAVRRGRHRASGECSGHHQRWLGRRLRLLNCGFRHGEGLWASEHPQSFALTALQVESRRIARPDRVLISTAAMSWRTSELAPRTVSSRSGSALHVATCCAAPLRSMTTSA